MKYIYERVAQGTLDKQRAAGYYPSEYRIVLVKDDGFEVIGFSTTEKAAKLKTLKLNKALKKSMRKK